MFLMFELQSRKLSLSCLNLVYFKKCTNMGNPSQIILASYTCDYSKGHF